MCRWEASPAFGQAVDTPWQTTSLRELLSTKPYADHYFTEAETAIKPYVDQGRLKIFKDGDEILPGVTAAIHPGHTLGASFFAVRSGEDAIVFMGDAVHVSAVHPDPSTALKVARLHLERRGARSQ